MYFSQVHGALGDESSDGGYAQHPRRDHSEKDLPHGPPPPGHRFLRALQGGVADWNGDDGSTFARWPCAFLVRLRPRSQVAHYYAEHPRCSQS